MGEKEQNWNQFIKLNIDFACTTHLLKEEKEKKKYNFIGIKHSGKLIDCFIAFKLNLVLAGML